MFGRLTCVDMKSIIGFVHLQKNQCSKHHLLEQKIFEVRLGMATSCVGEGRF